MKIDIKAVSILLVFAFLIYKYFVYFLILIAVALLVHAIIRIFKGDYGQNNIEHKPQVAQEPIQSGLVEETTQNTEGVFVFVVEENISVEEVLKVKGEIPEDIHKQETKYIDTNHPFYKKRIVFTGTLTHASRAEAIQSVRDIGGIVANSLSRSTHYLVRGYQDGYKLKGYETSQKENLATALNETGANIQIIDESEFWQIMGY
jgi:NAD-dependent DNA ligase